MKNQKNVYREGNEGVKLIPESQQDSPEGPSKDKKESEAQKKDSEPTNRVKRLG